MNKDYLTHWVIGVSCAAAWFWGDKVGIPPAATSLAASIVPAVLAHALAYTPPSTTAN